MCEHWVPLSSYVRLKKKVIDPHNTGEGNKKVAKCCQLAVSTVWLRDLSGLWRSRWHLQDQENSWRELFISQTPVWLQITGIPRSGGACLHKLDPREVSVNENLTCYFIVRSEECNECNLQKPDAIWRPVLCTDEVKIELFGDNQPWCVA